MPPTSGTWALKHHAFLSRKSESGNLSVQQETMYVMTTCVNVSHGNRLELPKWMTLPLLLCKWGPRSLRSGGMQRGRTSGWCSRSFETTPLPRALQGEGWRGVGELSHSFPGLARRAAVLPCTTRGQQITSLHTHPLTTPQARPRLHPPNPSTVPTPFPTERIEATGRGRIQNDEP